MSPSLETPSYPTRSREFLKNMPRTSSQNGIDLSTPFPMEILIVGAGLGGLATSIALARRGHKITLLEQASQLSEVGAGIQVPPNSTRFLDEWGLLPFLEKKVVEPDCITIHRWENGKVIGRTQLMPDFRKTFRAPYFVVHRAHYHAAMHELALQLAVNIRVGQKVVDYDSSRPSVTLEDGTRHSAHLIVAADGYKSVARKIVLGGLDKPPYGIGWAAYRAMVDVSKMEKDPDVSWLLERPGQHMWIGNHQHAMTYTIAQGRSFNMVMNFADHSDPNTWEHSEETALQDMRKRYSGWDPCLTKIINMVEKTMKWPLLSGDKLETWVADSGRLVILGDAAHAMVPWMSQGAAMAVEDAAALAEALSNVHGFEGLKPALRVFEKVRSKRAGQMQQASLFMGKYLHVPDGPEQEARDAAMRNEVEGRHFIESPLLWSDPVTQHWAYGYNAVEAIKEAWTISTARRKGGADIDGEDDPT